MLPHNETSILDIEVTAEVKLLARNKSLLCLLTHEACIHCHRNKCAHKHE